MINKKSSKEDLDEMQIQTRDKVGNQCFFILFSSLLIDLGLRNYGIKWAGSLLSIYAIIIICVVYYLIRVVRAGAYIRYSKKTLSIITGLFVTMVIAMGLIMILIKTNFFKESFNISYSSVLPLVIFLFVFIMIIIIPSIISSHKNDED